MSSATRTPTLDPTTQTEPLDVSNLFDLEVQVGPTYELPDKLASGDCTDDGCTASCASCGCS
ncbi:hypothetical protein [Nonomuraea salmonea]|uniref:FxLD family lantipeptide n=1 Tax=Nonomuraea salmonea TaxID=46181 RepID=A0ABV5NPI1_9ACTN